MACIRWLKYQYPKLKVHHSPNGGYRNAGEAAKFKAMGTSPGFPDVLIPYQSNGYCGLAIELKSEKGKASPEQIDWLAYLSQNGWQTHIIYDKDFNGLALFVDAVTKYLIAL